MQKNLLAVAGDEPEEPSSAPTSAQKNYQKKNRKNYKKKIALAGDEPEGFVFSADECRRAFDLFDRVRARPDKKGCVHTDWRMGISRAR